MTDPLVPQATPGLNGQIDQPQRAAARTRRRKLDSRDVLEALEKAQGIRSLAAKLLNVSRTTLSAYLELHPELTKALREIDESVGDVVEGKLLKAIQSDDIRAITFYLATRMKHRGFTTRVESTGAGGGPIQHEITPSADAMLALLEKMAAEKAKAPKGPAAPVAPVRPTIVSLASVGPVAPVAMDRKPSHPTLGSQGAPPNGRGPAIA